MSLPLVPKEDVIQEEISPEKLEEQKKKQEDLSDCVTMVLSVLTRSSYLIQLDQIRVIFILDDRVRTRLDSIIIEEIEEILEDITVLSNCELFDYIDSEELGKLLDELGDLDVNKARQYGDGAWNIFSKLITDYVIATWECRP